MSILLILSPVAGVFTVWSERPKLGTNRQFAGDVSQQTVAVNRESEYEAESESGSDYADYYNLQQFER